MIESRAATAVGSTYPTTTHERKHGPQGYVDPASYKPWLRDEFTFRCVYCLTREQWCQDPRGTLTVEHFMPRSERPERALEYDNLLYVCQPCNRIKGTASLPLEPSTHALGQHLQLNSDGTIVGLTAEGRSFADVLYLNDPSRLAPRRLVVELLHFLAAHVEPEAQAHVRRLLGYPEDLPDLARLRPPRGNSRAEGVARSCFERRRTGQLPDTY